MTGQILTDELSEQPSLLPIVSNWWRFRDWIERRQAKIGTT